MAQTLVNIMVHIIFSTKDRQALITPQIEPELFAYIGGILRNNKCCLLDAGGTSNHVHLIGFPVKECGSKFVDEGCEEKQFLMDQNKGSRIQKVLLARRLWRLFNRTVAGSQVEKIHCESETTSSQEIF
jgi:REP element-mobilizing transposase RayT